MNPLFSLKHTEDVLVFFFSLLETNGRKSISDKEVEKKQFCFTQNARFFVPINENQII